MRQKLGQHFLKNAAALASIAEAVAVKEGETILEIGPGHGELTNHLVECIGTARASRLVLFERDTTLIPALRIRFADLIADQRLTILEGNALNTLPAFIAREGRGGAPYKIVGNIPYYITGFLFRTIEALEPKPISCVFTIQKEVAERVAADAPKMNLLAASVQYWARAEVLLILPKHLFSPPPKVDSAVIRLTTHKERAKTPPHFYYSFAKTLFAQPRKTIANNLKTFPPLKKRTADDMNALFLAAGIEPTARAQHMHIETLKKLAFLLYNE